MDKKLHTHSFCFNREDNGGESFILTTTFFDNGDDINEKHNGIYTNQELSLQSYCNSASFNLYGATITPDDLRNLANELEKASAMAERIKAAVPV